MRRCQERLLDEFVRIQLFGLPRISILQRNKGTDGFSILLFGRVCVCDWVWMCVHVWEEETLKTSSKTVKPVPKLLFAFKKLVRACKNQSETCQKTCPKPDRVEAGAWWGRVCVCARRGVGVLIGRHLHSNRFGCGQF